mmetsp:Transcript_30298/g.66294  ORF Transcript_30298/g.66294 Transcript_30298/m.66294 type:complete len:209 (-) Transcript_30298:254-880(-)
MLEVPLDGLPVVGVATTAYDHRVPHHVVGDWAKVMSWQDTLPSWLCRKDVAHESVTTQERLGPRLGPDLAEAQATSPLQRGRTGRLRGPPAEGSSSPRGKGNHGVDHRGNDALGPRFTFVSVFSLPSLDCTSQSPGTQAPVAWGFACRLLLLRFPQALLEEASKLRQAECRRDAQIPRGCLPAVAYLNLDQKLPIRDKHDVSLTVYQA